MVPESVISSEEWPVMKDSIAAMQEGLGREWVML